MNIYKGITFAKSYNKTFAEFKKKTASTHIFNNIHPSKREQEIKINHKIATNGKTSGATDEGKKITTK